MREAPGAGAVAPGAVAVFSATLVGDEPVGEGGPAGETASGFGNTTVDKINIEYNYWEPETGLAVGREAVARRDFDSPS